MRDFRPNPLAVGQQVRKHRPDYGLIVVASILLVIGLVVMYSISPALAAQGGGVGQNYFVTKQFVAVILGIVAFIFASRVSLKTWEKLQQPIIIIAFLLCMVTFIVGGIANRWIQLGLFSFQPVELVKFALIVSGSTFLAKIIASGNTKNIKAYKPLAIVLLVFSFIIVVLQHDLGSAVVLLGMAGIMAFVAGLPMKRILIILGVAIVVVTIAISSTPYRRDRLVTFLQPETDCVDIGYHACQALIAVGSGGVLGLGLGRSVQAYGYLPEAANDSIFAIYAEKFGFIGSIILIGLIGYLLFRILNIMQRAPNRIAQLLCASVFAWLGLQSLINIGAMIGLLPLKGITLPFISYGGTSVVFAMAALGIVFHISGYTTMRKSTLSFEDERTDNEGNNNWRRNSRSRYTVTRSGL